MTCQLAWGARGPIGYVIATPTLPESVRTAAQRLARAPVTIGPSGIPATRSS